MEIVSILICTILFLSPLLLYHLINKQNKNKDRGKLPPGSMGWPYVGDTFQLYSQDPNIFFASKQKRFLSYIIDHVSFSSFWSFIILHGYSLSRTRYGEIFKTQILGCPCVMLASPEAARFVLVTHAHLFKPTYPKSKEKLIGPSALFFHQGSYHTRIRKLVQTSLSPETIRKLVPDIEATAIYALNSWVSGEKVNVFQEMKKVSLGLSVINTS